MEPDRSKSWLWNTALLILLVCSYFAVRYRVIHAPLIFEEGIFANLIINRPCGPLYNKGGQIDGESFYGYFQHPAPSYELLRGAGWLAKNWLTPVFQDDETITPRLRILCSLFQLTLWLALAALLCISNAFRGKWPWVLLFVAALSPLAIKSSVSLQTDNTAGVFFCGVAAFLFMLVAKNRVPQKVTGLMIFLGAFVAGLGKQEWSLSLLTAAITLPLLTKLLEPETPIKTILSVSLFIVFGLLLANLTSLSYDPINYTKGFEIMAKFSKATPYSDGQWSLGHWLWLSKLRAFYMFVCFVLGLFFLLSVSVKKKQGMLGYVLFLYGGFLFIGYALSDWNDEVRYFAPSLAVLTIASITAAPVSFPKILNKAVILIFSAVGLSTVLFLASYIPPRNFHLEELKNGTLRSTADTVLFIDSGAAWNKPEINYTNSNKDFETARQAVWDIFEKKLVKP